MVQSRTNDLNAYVVSRHPLGENLTRDEYLLGALQPSLSHAFLDGVVLAIQEVAAAFTPVKSTAVVCTELVEHLRERLAVRQVTRSQEVPWYPDPSVRPS